MFLAWASGFSMLFLLFKLLDDELDLAMQMTIFYVHMIPDLMY